MSGLMKRNVSLLVYQRSNAVAEFAGGRTALLPVVRRLATVASPALEADFSAGAPWLKKASTEDASKPEPFVSSEDQDAALRAKRKQRKRSREGGRRGAGRQAGNGNEGAGVMRRRDVE